MPIRPLREDEIAAMWVYGDEYSRQNLGIIDWWATQPARRHADIESFLDLLAMARKRAAKRTKCA